MDHLLDIILINAINICFNIEIILNHIIKMISNNL